MPGPAICDASPFRRSLRTIHRHLVFLAILLLPFTQIVSSSATNFRPMASTNPSSTHGEQDISLLELDRDIEREMVGRQSRHSSIEPLISLLLAADTSIAPIGVVKEDGGSSLLGQTQSKDQQEAERLNAEAIRLYRAGRYDEAIPLAERALKFQEGTLGAEHPKVTLSLNNLANLYRAKGDNTKAESLFQRALVIREKVLGPHHPDVAASLENLAYLYIYKKDYSKAEPLYQRVLAIREKAVGPVHTDVANALVQLALLYEGKGDYAKAEPLYQRSLSIWEQALGPETPLFADKLEMLASWSHFSRRDYTKAEPLYLRALAIREKALGLDHPRLAATLNSIGQVYTGRGDFVKAEPLYQRALAIHEKALGPEHPDVAAALGNLASVYSTVGDYVKAEPLYQRVLAIREKALGPDHPTVATALQNLADLYKNKGDYTKAETLLQRALAIRLNLKQPINNLMMGPDSPDLADELEKQAQLYLGKLEYEKAEPLFQRALAIREKAFGPDHPAIATTLEGLAKLYERLGYTKTGNKGATKAESLLQQALAIREKALSPDHPTVATTLESLADLYQGSGGYTKAEPLRQRALAIRETSLGPDHPTVATTLESLAEFYERKGDYVKAEPLLQRALTIQEKNIGPAHPDIAVTLDRIAQSYRRVGDYTKAESLYQRSLSIREKAFGPGHPSIISSLYSLVDIYSLKKDYVRVELLYQRYLSILKKSLGPDHSGIAYLLNEIADFFWARGDAPKATNYLTLANGVIERDLTRNLIAGSERQKQLYLSQSSSAIDRSLTFHAMFAPKNVAASRMAMAMLFSRKGRVLDAMSDTLAQLRRYATPQDQALLEQYTVILTQLSQLMVVGPNNKDVRRSKATLDQLREQLEELESTISARNNKLRAQLQPITFASVQQALAPNTTLIEFASYLPQNILRKSNALDPEARRYVAYVLNSQGVPLWTDLGDAEAIDTAVEAFRRALRDPTSTDVRSLARALDGKVMEPVRKLLGETKRVLLSPDGTLNLIPFAALVDEQDRYLVERYEFSYLTSGRDLLRLQAHQPSKQDAVIVADPAFGEMPYSSAAKRRDVGLSPGPSQAAVQNISLAHIYFLPLPGTAEEAKSLRALLPRATMLIKEQATETAIKQLRSPSTLHIATHGFFLEDQKVESPNTRDVDLVGKGPATLSKPSDLRIEDPLLRSGLALAGANLRKSGDDDGVLTAKEVVGLDLWGTKLVVLSACDTGVGEVKNGEGVYGLRRALVLAGSETQVMSLWPVSDVGTRDLMIEYYKALQLGEGRSEGLRQVQLQMLKRKDRSHPFYWASFIQSGEWANLEGKR